MGSRLRWGALGVRSLFVGLFCRFRRALVARREAGSGIFVENIDRLGSICDVGCATRQTDQGPVTSTQGVCNRCPRSRGSPIRDRSLGPDRSGVAQEGPGREARKKISPKVERFVSRRDPVPRGICSDVDELTAEKSLELRSRLGISWMPARDVNGCQGRAAERALSVPTVPAQTWRSVVPQHSL